MPSQSHPRAQFVPIAPDFDLDALVENNSNFDYVTRLSTERLKEHSVQSFEALVLAVVIKSGKPLVIEDWASSLPASLFSKQWLQEHIGSKPEMVRDISNRVNIPMTIGHYLNNMEKLTKQFNPSSYRDPKRQRLYLKDIDCPDTWADHLKSIMPESVYYLNDCIESRTGGDGAILEPNEYGQMRYGKGVAPAGDLMSSLPSQMRALNMMCYVGHEGTYTPAHREMCASLGHNIMVEASEDGNGENKGSSIWFMTETKEREVVSEYFLSMLGHDIEVEKHFAQVNAWKKAPFNVWVVEQKVGDLILIPPLAPHQVWNRGTRTMKAAWNRTTVDTLELALHEALPRGRMVCRDEQYKNKAIVYYTLVKYYDLLRRDTIEVKMWKYGRINQLLKDFKRLFVLWTEIIVAEMFSPKLPAEDNVEFLPYDSNITCSYCRGNIFNKFLTCKSCIQNGPNGEEDTYDICMDCFAMGRSCACISNLSWCEQWDWNALLERHEQWRTVIVQFDGFFDVARSAPPIQVARKRYGKKPVAEVCQEQLKLRPWKDILQPEVQEPVPGESDIEPEADDEGRVKKSKKGIKNFRGKLIPIKDKTQACHICCHHEWNWKLAFCSSCNLAYCYGVLWRAFDLMPQTVMEDKDWQCPKCQGICSCGRCRKSSSQKPYTPKGTLLGHDTRKVADYRSVESLVDFSKTNLTWLRGGDDSNPQESTRMRKLKEKAELEKAYLEPVDTRYYDEVDPSTLTNGARGNPSSNDHMPTMPEIDHDIDPLLRNSGGSPTGNIQTGGPYQSQSLGLTSNGHDHPVFVPVSEEYSLGWMDDLENLEVDSPLNEQSANYPVGLFGPEIPAPTSVAANHEAEPSYPDPSIIGQPRMMGIGYFQQGNGVDRILYDTPEEEGSDQSLSQQTPSKNPNFAFSDLIDPALQPEATKKRRRSGSDNEEEFFTSKKQKRAAESRKLKLASNNDGDDAVVYSRQTSARPPRRHVGQARSYQDLGEDAVPIEEDEGPSAVSSYKKPKSTASDDSALASRAMSRLGKPLSERTRPSRKSKEENGNAVGSPGLPETSHIVRARRKSSWLARKSAGDLSTDLSNGAAASITRGSGSFARTVDDLSSASQTVQITRGSENGGADIPAVDREANDALEEPIASQIGPEIPPQNQEQPDGLVTYSASENHPDAQTARLSTQKAASKAIVQMKDKPPPRRRGRPPKTLHPPVVLRSISPIETQPAKKYLSLKEKLAAKGKSFKIVAQKVMRPRATLSSKPATNTSTQSVAKPTLESPSATSSIGRFDEAQTKNSTPEVYLGPRPVGINSKNDISMVTVQSSSQPQLRNAGPTVVRLVSPDSEDDGNESSVNSKLLDSSSDDSDSSIPAVKRVLQPVSSRRASRGGGVTPRKGRPPSKREIRN